MVRAVAVQLGQLKKKNAKARRARRYTKNSIRLAARWGNLMFTLTTKNPHPNPLPGYRAREKGGRGDFRGPQAGLFFVGLFA